MAASLIMNQSSFLAYSIIETTIYITLELSLEKLETPTLNESDTLPDSMLQADLL